MAFDGSNECLCWYGFSETSIASQWLGPSLFNRDQLGFVIEVSCTENNSAEARYDDMESKIMNQNIADMEAAILNFESQNGWTTKRLKLHKIGR